MFVRREFLYLAAGCASLVGSHVQAFGQTQYLAMDDRWGIPKGACDAHVHVIGELNRFPMSLERDYTPPPATADQLIRALDELAFERVVIVTPTVYGTNNAVTLDAIKRVGRNRARGIVLVERDVPSEALDRMGAQGVCGIRLLLGGGPQFTLKTAQRKLKASFDLVGPQGWHLDVSMPPEVTAQLIGELKYSPVPLVFDYFGWVAGGPDQPGCREILALLELGKAYIKLSEPYRLSKETNYDDLTKIVQLYLKTNRERILWGSGWPHVDSSGSKAKPAPNIPVTNAHLLRVFERWVPDGEDRRTILVDNPNRLYKF